MTTTTLQHTPANWLAEDLIVDTSWTYRLSDAEAADLITVVRAAPARKLLDYRRSDFPFAESTLATLGKAFTEVQHGRGISLLKGLPRDGVSEAEFERMTWAIGLHFGVARPQDRETRYLNEVRNVGTVYRSPTGRGYSSNAELDFHVDGSDIVGLTCYNTAKSGGQSMIASSERAFTTVLDERPDLAEVLQQTYAFGLQSENADGQAAWFPMPVYAIEGRLTFCMWVRNRVENAVGTPGAIPLTDIMREAVDYLDEVVRRPEHMYVMDLEAGDMQLLRNHSMLHSRTEFEDFEDPARARLLYRLWIARSDSPRLPESWAIVFGTREPGEVRGGIPGKKYGDAERTFDREQAADHGMIAP